MFHVAKLTHHPRPLALPASYLHPLIHPSPPIPSIPSPLPPPTDTPQAIGPAAHVQALCASYPWQIDGPLLVKHLIWGMEA